MNIARKIAHQAEAVKGGAKKTAGRARRSIPRDPRGGHERAGGHAVDHESGDHSQPAVDPRPDRCRADDVALRGLQRRRVAVHLARMPELTGRCLEQIEGQLHRGRSQPPDLPPAPRASTWHRAAQAPPDGSCCLPTRRDPVAGSLHAAPSWVRSSA